MELFNVVSVEEAKNIIQSNFSYKLGCEKVSILQCVDRISYEDIKANSSIPQFKRSTVDGFAVNSRDVFGASEAIPSMMDLIGEVLMGNIPPAQISVSGECLYVPTGGMLPDGADSVVMVEYSERLDDNTILINSPVAPGDNTIQVGEDISVGEVVIKGGERLRPYEIGVLASLGIKDIMVYKKPKVAIISTGDEVVTCEKEPSMGEVRDINTYLLWSSVLKDGGEPVSYGIIKDDFNLLKDTVDRAINECDLVLISGGSSVGTKDQTLKVINSYKSGGVLVHGISIKPGKPTLIGKSENKIIFGLPGHPLAAAIIYKIIVRNYIDSLTNYQEKSYGISAFLSENYHKAKGREEYLPVALEESEGRIIAKPIYGKSGLITAFSKAFGYIRIDKNIEGLKQEEKVVVYRF